MVCMSTRSEASEDLGKSIEELIQRPQARHGPGVLENKKKFLVTTFKKERFRTVGQL